MKRRSVLKAAIAGAVLCISGWQARRVRGAPEAGWPAEAFRAESLDAALQALYDGAVPAEDASIDIGAADLAENGAVVPVKVTVEGRRVSALTLLADRNPVPLVARFELAPNVRGFIATRIKMAESSNIVAVAETEGQAAMNRKFVKVTIGGC